MMKVLSCRFYNSFGPFNMLTFKWCSEIVFFLESKLNKFFTACNFRNEVAMTIIFFYKMFKIIYRFQKWQKRNQKMFLVLKIIGFVSATRNSLNLEKNTCHWHWMCNETSLRFNISLWEIFFKSGSLRVIEKLDESALNLIWQGFGKL